MKTILCVLTLLLFVSGCASNPPNFLAEPPIRIGGIFILSGIGADWGTATANGAQLAVKDINSAGGINGRSIELVLQDNPGDDPKSGITAYQQLRSQGIDVMMGTTWSTSAWAVMPLACEDHTVLVSATVGTTKFAQACNETFNVYPADTRQSYALGQELATNGYERLAVIASQESWQGDNARAVRAGFESAGGETVYYELVDPAQKEFRTGSLKLMQSKPDVVFVLPNFAAIGTAADHVRMAGYTGQIVSTYLDASIITQANGAWEDGIIPSAFTPTPQFAARYREVYGTEATTGADSGYDAVMMIAQAMKESGKTDAASVTTALQSVKIYAGMSGDLTFDVDGGASKATSYLQVRNGMLVPYTW